MMPFSIHMNDLRLNGNENPFRFIAFGYDEDPDHNDSVYPFNPTGQVSPGFDEISPIPVQFTNKKHINLLDDLMNYNLIFTYLLKDEPNTQHELQVHFVFDIYSNY